MHTNPDSHNTADTKPATGGRLTRDQPAVSRASAAMQAPPRVHRSPPQGTHWQTLPVNTAQIQPTVTVSVSNPHGYGYQPYRPQSHTPRTTSNRQFQAGKSFRNAPSGGRGAGRGHGVPSQGFWVGNKGKSRCEYRSILS